MKQEELKKRASEVLDILARHGAMTPGQISAETWMLPAETKEVLSSLMEADLILMRADNDTPDGRFVAITAHAYEVMMNQRRLNITQKKFFE